MREQEHGVNPTPPEWMSDERLSMREIIAIVFVRKWLITGTFLAVMGVAAFFTFYFLSPTYEASSTLIMNTSDLIVPLADAPPTSDFEKLTTFHTQRDIIESGTIAGMVVDKLHLDKTRAIGNLERFKLFLKSIRRKLGHWFNIKRWQEPEDYRAAAINAVIKNINIETRPDSKALKITYRAKNPEEAAKTLNTMVAVYIQYFHNLIEKRAGGITGYLESRVGEVQKALKDSEDALTAYREKDTVNLGNATGSRKRGTTEPTLLDLADSEKVQNEIKLYILSMEEDLRKRSTEYPADDPSIVALKRKIDRYVKALNDVPRRELALHRLKRDVELKQEAYMFLEKNLEKARMVQAGSTDQIRLINVLEKAKSNDDPVSPKPKLAMILAVFFGLAFGVVLALVGDYLDHRIRSVRDVRKYLGLRTIASLKRL